MAKDLAAQYEPIIQGAAKAFDLDPNILRGMAQTESGFDPDVISGKRPSKAGAIGIMQFMPETAKRFGVDPTNPKQAIFASAQYLRENLDKFGGDYQKAVAGYNWGENRDAYNQSDWVKRLPAETKGYVKKVLTHAAQRAGSDEEKPTAAPTPAPSNEGMPEARGEVPEWGRKNPRLYGLAGAAREVLGPIIEAGGAILGGIGGAAAGAPAGPLGIAAGGVGGAGAGYATGKEATRLADIALGNVAPTPVSEAPARVLSNVAEGGMMETGGRLAAPVVSAIAKGGAQVIGKAIDLPKQSTQKAARIARESVGDMDVVINALRNARPGVTPAQALGEAGINEPTAMALLDRMKGQTTASAKYFTDVPAAENAAALNALAEIAGGTTQTGAKAGQAAAKKEVSALLEPMKDQILARANVGGTVGATLRQEAADQGAKAAAAVEDVRRFTAAGERAPGVFEKVSAERYPGEPKAPLRYTYGGDLAKKADEVASQAAKGSLEFGESARFAQAAADQLEAAGLKPLESAPILQSLQRVSSDPKLAGSEAVKYLPRVAEDIQKWTSAGGVIDARALDSIRKNSVNAVINDMTNLDTKAKKALAAKVMTELKPVLIDAIEGAGGKGYRDYLTNYANEMQKIGQMKLGAKAMDLFEKSPKRFVALVEGNSPKDVEKIFGPGSYDIVSEMSQDAMKTLQSAGTLLKGRAAAKPTEEGLSAFSKVLESNLPLFRIPNFLSPKITATNTVLDVLEKKVGKETLRTLTEASKTTKDLDALLNTLPAVERNKVLRILNNSAEWGNPQIRKALNKPGVAAGVINALRGPVETENALVQ